MVSNEGEKTQTLSGSRKKQSRVLFQVITWRWGREGVGDGEAHGAVLPLTPQGTSALVVWSLFQWSPRSLRFEELGSAVAGGTGTTRGRVVPACPGHPGSRLARHRPWAARAPARSCSPPGGTCPPGDRSARPRSRRAHSGRERTISRASGSPRLSSCSGGRA